VTDDRDRRDRPARHDIETPLSRATLNAARPLDVGSYPPTRKILPELCVMKIGGQSIMDRGGDAVLALVAEIVDCAKSHQLLIGTGGGTRARHIYHLALDLELPVGVLAALGAATAEQNARMLALLLAEHGGVYDETPNFFNVPALLRTGCIPIKPGMPPFGYWAVPGQSGRIPDYRTDAGVYLMAEALGAKRMIYVKDEAGLYDDDPKKNPRAKLIPKISARELLDARFADLVIEPVVVQNMLAAEHVREVQIINGLERGLLTRALAGEHVGTIIHA
jgi:molybdenum storage protein